MSKVIYGMMQSLDGYIAGPEGGPGLPMPNDDLHRHFNEMQRQSSASLYGRRMYEVMRYWGTDDPDRPPVAIEFADAWQKTPKVVVSTTLQSVSDPDTRLVRGDLERVVKELKANPGGDIDVSGAGLAASLSRLGLIDEYRLYVYPLVLGGGKPFFEAGLDLKLELIGAEPLHGVVLTRYRPAH
jgi:dihydrofolate reductase